MQLVIQYSLIWLKCYLTYLVIEKNGFSAEELKDLELHQFVIYKSSYSEVPKLIIPTVPTPSCSSSSGTNNPVDAFKKGIKHETSQYPVLKDVHFFDKFEMEFMTLACVHDIEVFLTQSKCHQPRLKRICSMKSRSLLCQSLCIALEPTWALPLQGNTSRIARPKCVGTRSKMRLLALLI